MGLTSRGADRSVRLLLTPIGRLPASKTHDGYIRVPLFPSDVVSLGDFIWALQDFLIVLEV